MRFLINCCLFLAFAIDVYGEKEKIVGGLSTSVEAHPYQASLRLYGKHFCGGTIISEKHILTAAHCVDGILTAPYSNAAVYTGSSMSVGNSGNQRRILRVQVHESYAGSVEASYHNDIAIITLADEIKFDRNQKKINLASRDVYDGESATVTGWGIKKYPSTVTSPVLQMAAMDVILNHDCKSYMFPFQVYKEQVCAFQGKGVGVCSGDSGGPLVANEEVIGIASWVVPCGEGYPDVYTKVYAYKDWIKSIINQNSGLPNSGLPNSNPWGTGFNKGGLELWDTGLKNDLDLNSWGTGFNYGDSWKNELNNGNLESWNIGLNPGGSWDTGFVYGDPGLWNVGYASGDTGSVFRDAKDGN